MFNKFKYLIIFILMLLPVSVYGGSLTGVMVGDKYYDNLTDAISNARSTDTIKLISDSIVDETIEINKTVNIDLNGNDISAPSVVFLVQGGSLNVTGKGIIRETEPNYGPIKVIGSNTYTDDKYSLVNIDKDVTLEGWSGIFITHDNYNSHGVTVYFDGTINAINDINGGSGAGIYVNGNIKHEDKSPVVNIFDNAKINSTGNGLYIAGYSTFNINKAYIQGKESGIAIKSGILNINGADVYCDGEDKTPTDGYNNGIKPSGAAIQIESNNGYKGNIELNITSGNFKSKNSNVIYEYIGRGDSSLVKNIDILNGSFISESLKDVFLLSNSFKSKHISFISGGEYSSDPSPYLKSGYSIDLENDLYKVLKMTFMETFFEGKEEGGNIFKISMLVILIGLGVLIYLYREKIKSFISRLFK